MSYFLKMLDLKSHGDHAKGKEGFDQDFTALLGSYKGFCLHLSRV